MIVNGPRHGNKLTVVVVGVQRGGTSMPAGVIRELGIPMGKNLGSNHEDPEFLSKKLWDLYPVISRRNNEYDVWGWKVPHTSEYIVKLYKKLRNPHIIMVFRNLVAISESQMKRSNTDFAKAFRFSKNRQAQIADIVEKIDCPLMLVDYDQAIRKPAKFVDELICFLGLEVEAELQKKAVAFVDAELGYQRASFEKWAFCVQSTDAVDAERLREVDVKRTMYGIAVGEHGLLGTTERPCIEFLIRRGPNENNGQDVYILSLVRDRDPDEVQIVVDTGSGFSRNMSERVMLNRGRNYVRLEAPKISGIRVMPQFCRGQLNAKIFRIIRAISKDCEAQLNTKLFELYEE